MQQKLLILKNKQEISLYCTIFRYVCALLIFYLKHNARRNSKIFQ
ncbi:hypothetical protein B0I18_103353 [Taibaiella chishuiensis]|uniref:Uncharacterized protein n=1 Tax=Taibaiella chishuiensis TaxID=1434707 RepID=A0A2P8D6C0_9BACT|nr:hypothetical protein B0I18_103353 [Taibaiella chishuiensis]